jgi:methylamine utilization protein MauE
VIARVVLALVLAASALAKLAAPGSSRAALGTFGVHRERVRWAVWGALVTAELALAVGVAAGVDAAAYAAAAVMAAFALALGAAMARGRRGAPCACFGARSTVSPFAIGRNVGLAAGFALVPALPSSSLSTDQWLGLGLGVSLLATIGLAVAVLALVREVGMLRLRLGPDSALEIAEEGPELGSASALVSRFEADPGTELALAIFVSSGCRACQALEPAIESLSNDPVVALETFDEVADSEAWRESDVPGSPYAVALGLDGTVLAKGTFNNLAQLESVLATAERRRGVFALGGAGA